MPVDTQSPFGTTYGQVTPEEQFNQDNLNRQAQMSGYMQALQTNANTALQTAQIQGQNEIGVENARLQPWMAAWNDPSAVAQRALQAQQTQMRGSALSAAMAQMGLGSPASAGAAAALGGPGGSPGGATSADAGPAPMPAGSAYAGNPAATAGAQAALGGGGSAPTPDLGLGGMPNLNDPQTQRLRMLMALANGGSYDPMDDQLRSLDVRLGMQQLGQDRARALIPGMLQAGDTAGAQALAQQYGLPISSFQMDPQKVLAMPDVAEPLQILRTAAASNSNNAFGVDAGKLQGLMQAAVQAMVRHGLPQDVALASVRQALEGSIANPTATGSLLRNLLGLGILPLGQSAGDVRGALGLSNNRG